MTPEAEARLMARLAAIHKRVEWMANEEARSVWVRGLAARGVHLKEKEQLLEETEKLLDRLRGDQQ